ncbi:DUF922 domain-containing protein [Thalassotalea sp. G2M2-11]|uniref:DUF922 domain-containing protein n=1 Tax=Thalassotalea sp. G2M2-11 TaxID=2787627 RepID=UPI0019D192E2|nr:DUF922 domain-containing protein [Thalassotalea sp. G2M2-11]
MMVILKRYRVVFSLCLLLCSQLGYAKVDENIATSYYQISGKNFKELSQSVLENGPTTISGKQPWAKVAWNILTEYHFKTLKNGCLFVLSSMEVEADIFLPIWQNVSDVSPKTRLWWQEFSLFMEQHEQRHVDNVMEVAKSFQQAITQFDVFTSCDAALQHYFDVKNQYMDEINANDFAIDRAALSRINSNERLFEPLKDIGGISIESGGMRSVISF